MSSNSYHESTNPPGLTSIISSWLNKAIDSSKYFVNKVGELELGSKLIDVTSLVAETTSILFDRTAELAVN